MKKIVEFIDAWGDTPEEFFPIPAVKELPEWYKNMAPYFSNNGHSKIKDRTHSTIKKCNPVFDAISTGYLLKLSVDIHVSKEDGAFFYRWPSGNPIGFHPTKQVTNYPGQEERKEDYPKFLHPWIIKTPPGYSTLFVTPIHHPTPFHILEGVVDTDSYHDIVNLPFYIKDENFTGVIKAGTPLAQIIPIKRESWNMESRRASLKDVEKRNQVAKKIVSVFINGYKKFFWQKKQYR